MKPLAFLALLLALYLASLLHGVIGNQDTSMPPTHDVQGTGVGPHNSIITKFDGLKNKSTLHLWMETKVLNGIQGIILMSKGF